MKLSLLNRCFLILGKDRKKNRKIDLHNYSQLSKKRKDNDQVTFIKLVPIHPHPHSHPQKLAALNEEVQFVKQLPV